MSRWTTACRRTCSHRRRRGWCRGCKRCARASTAHCPRLDHGPDGERNGQGERCRRPARGERGWPSGTLAAGCQELATRRPRTSTRWCPSCCSDRSSTSSRSCSRVCVISALFVLAAHPLATEAALGALHVQVVPVAGDWQFCVVHRKSLWTVCPLVDWPEQVLQCQADYEVVHARAGTAAGTVRAALEQTDTVGCQIWIGARPRCACVAKVAATDAVDALAKVALEYGLRGQTCGRPEVTDITLRADVLVESAAPIASITHAAVAVGWRELDRQVMLIGATDRIADALRALGKRARGVGLPRSLARGIVRARPGARRVGLRSRPGYEDGENERAQHAKPSTRARERRHSSVVETSEAEDERCCDSQSRPHRGRAPSARQEEVAR